MHPDSRQGTLPLAEALIALSDVALVAAIQAQQSAVPGDVLEELERYTLESIMVERRAPRRFLPMALSRMDVQRLDRAWEALFSAFRLKLERADILLEGVPTPYFGEPVVSRLPRELAAQFVFDPAAGAIFVGGQTFVNVSAVHASAFREGDSSVEVLPMRDALLAWGDQAALAEYKRVEWLVKQMCEYELLPTPYLRSETDAEPSLDSFEKYQLEVPRLALGLAWAGLEHDMRRRIESGELKLAGVQTFPLAEADRAPIPHLWAIDFQFDFGAGRLSVVRNNVTTHTYVAVQFVRAAAPVSPALSVDAPPAPRQSGKPGRSAHEPLIEEALRKHWDDIQAHAARRGGTPRWTEAARLLEKRMRKNATPTELLNLPQYDTIRTRLRPIYARVLSEKGLAGQSAQLDNCRSARQA